MVGRFFGALAIPYVKETGEFLVSTATLWGVLGAIVFFVTGRKLWS